MISIKMSRQNYTAGHFIWEKKGMNFLLHNMNMIFYCLRIEKDFDRNISKGFYNIMFFLKHKP